MTIQDEIDQIVQETIARRREAAAAVGAQGGGVQMPAESLTDLAQARSEVGDDTLSLMRQIATNRLPPPTFEDLGYRYLSVQEQRDANRRAEKGPGFWASLGSSLTSAENLPFVGGGFAAGSLGRFIYLDNKLRKTGLEPDEEREHVKMWADLVRDPGVREMAGDIMGALPGFAAEIGTGIGLTSAAARTAAKRIIRDQAASAATKSLAKRIARSQVLGGITTTAGLTAASEAVPEMFGMGGGRWTAYALQRALPDLRNMDAEDWESLEGLANGAVVDMLQAKVPIWQGALDQAIEVGSEMVGGGIGKAMARTAAGARVLALQSRVLNKIAGSVGYDGAEFLTDMAKRVRYDGPILEMLEERVGDLARVATGLEDLDALVPDLDEFAAEVFALSMPALGGASIRRAINVRRGTLASDPAPPAPNLAAVPDLSQEDQKYVLDRVTAAGVKGAKLVRPTTVQEIEAVAYAAEQGRQLALIDAQDLAGFGGVALRPDLIVAARSWGATDMLAAHELQETASDIATPEELQAKAQELEAIKPGFLDAAFSAWEKRVAEGGKATQGDKAQLRVTEGSAVGSEWVAQAMLFAARNAEAEAALARVAAGDTMGFWRRLWSETQTFLGLASKEERSRYLHERAARASTQEAQMLSREAGAPLTEREAAQAARTLAGYVRDSKDRIGPVMAERQRAADEARAAADEAARRERDAAIPSQEGRAQARKERQEAAKVRKHPKPGDIVRVTSRGNQGLADVLALINEGTPQERLRVRLRPDVRGEPGGRAQVGNRGNRTIEVPRSEVRLHELRAPDAVSDLGGRQRKERERAEEGILDAAAKRITTTEPVKAWNEAVRGGRPAKPRPTVKGKGAGRRTVFPPSTKPAKPKRSTKGPRAVAPVVIGEDVAPVPLPLAGSAKEAEEGDPVPFDEPEPEVPGVGHLTELPDISIAEERLARVVAQRLTAMAPMQTSYQGNKREFLENEALNLARLIAAAQDTEELYDWYAGGGSYGLSLAAANVLPRLKRITVNEADPIRALRLRQSMEHGGTFLDLWRSSPFLRKVHASISPLRAGSDSTSPMKTAIKHLRGDGKKDIKGQRSYARYRAMHGEYQQSSEMEKAALLAVFDMLGPKMKAQSLDEIIEIAREDAGKVQQLTAAVQSRGLDVRISMLDSTGDEAVEVVRAGGPAMLLLDPPYHKSDAGNYTNSLGVKVDMASDQALAMYTQDASRMARLGHVAVYHNKATPEARDMLYRALGGNTHMRVWARQKRGSRGQGMEVVGYVYGRDFARSGRARSGADAGPAVAGAEGSGREGELLGQPGERVAGDARSAAAGAGAARSRQNPRGRLAARWDVIGAADYLYDALNGLTGEARSRGVSLLAEQSMAEENVRGWDPFDGFGLPSRAGVPLLDQGLVERLALRTATQRRERPLTLVDHVLAMGGIDLRGMQLTNEAGDIVERILAGRGGNAAGVPSGLIYLPNSKEKSGGMRPDDIREGLVQAGFRGEEPDGRMSFDDMIDAIEAELNGEWPRVSEADEALLAGESSRLEVLRETEQLMSATVEDVAQAPASPVDPALLGGLFDDTAAPFAPGGMRPWAWKYAPMASLPKRVMIDGRERWTINSEGLPIADSWEKIVNFWRWFGESLATMLDGKPVVLYYAGLFDENQHGVFAENDEGIHLGSRKAALDRLIEKAIGHEVGIAYMEEVEGDWVWISSDRKTRSDEVDEVYPSAMAARYGMSRWMEREYQDDPERLTSLGYKIFAGYVKSGRTFAAEDVGSGWWSMVSVLRGNQAGYGSIAYRNKYEDPGSTAWMVWEPSRIKSVENFGTFSVDDPRVRYAPGWHGGPRRFERFSTKYVNTGEKAQMYGWGLYFASKRAVAEHYRQALSNHVARAVLVDGDDPYVVRNVPDEHWRGFMMFSAMSGFYKPEEAVQGRREMVRDLLAIGELDGYRREEVLAESAFLEEYGDRIKIRPEDNGALYHVELAPAEDEYLLWDEPFDMQSQKVQDGLLRLLGMDTIARAVGNASLGGLWLYRMAAEQARKKQPVEVRNAPGGAPQVASENLFLVGIRGIKYLDGMSRADGEGSHNYVIFDDADIEIIERFAPGFAPGGARARSAAQRKSKRRAEGQRRAALDRRTRSTMDVLAEMLSTDVHEVERIQREVWARTGKADESTDFVGAIDLARSKAPAQIEDLMQRLLERVSRFKGKGALEDLQRLVYVKTAPFRNAWLRVRQADDYLRGRLESIERLLKTVGSKLDPGRLGRLQGEVLAIQRVLGAEAEARLNYALRRGVKISDNPAGIDNVKAEQELARLRSKLGAGEADAFLEWLREENRRSLDHEVEAGLLSAETAAKWHEREPYYVSLRDVDPEMDDAAGYRSGRSMSVGKPYSRALGRESETEGALSAWLEDKIRRHELAARNQAHGVAAKLARTAGAESGLQVLETRPREDQVPFAVAFYENGQRKWILYPTAQAADALKGLHGRQVGELLGLVGQGTRFFSRMVTSRNPAFWLPNFLRDTTHALWTLTAERGFKEGAKVWARAWSLLPSVLRSEFARTGPNFEAIREAKLSGVKTTWVGPRNVKELIQQMVDALQDQGGPRKFVRSALRAFDAISDGFEAATRVATYQVMIESGETPRQAALIAKNATVNFDRKGTLTPALSALYSFFNPGVQGSLRLIKAATGSKRGALVATATATIGVVWEMLCYALSDDDEVTGLPVYALLSPWSKERMLHLPFSVGGSYLTYPLPYGIASIFGAGRRAAHLVAPSMDPTTTAATELWGAFVQGINEFQPMGNVTDPVSALAPTLIRPVVEVELNRKFTGDPIMRDKTSFGQELPDSARAFATIGDRASGWLGQLIADVLNAGGPDDVETGLDVSPETIQHYIEWLTAGYGLRELDRVSQFLMSSREVPTLPNTPLLRNFTNEVASQAISENYYQLRDRAEDVWKRAKNARGERRAMLLGEDPEMYGMAGQFRATDNRLRMLQQKMDGASREERIELQRQRVALQGQMVRAYYGTGR